MLYFPHCHRRHSITSLKKAIMIRPPLPAALRLFSLWIVLIISSTAAQLVITEIYRDPPGTEASIGGGGSHEFIELVNLGPDTIPLDGLCITNGREADTILTIRDSIPDHKGLYNVNELTPGAIAVILDPDYRTAVVQNPRLRFNFPYMTSVLLMCGDNEFGSSGLAATHGIACYRGTKKVIDTLLCIAADIPYPEKITTSTPLMLTQPENREGYSLHVQNILASDGSLSYRISTPSPGSYPALQRGWLGEFRLGLEEDGITIACTLQVLATNSATDEGRPLPQWKLTGLRETIEGSLNSEAYGASAAFTFKADSVPLRLSIETGEQSVPSWALPLSTVWLPETSLRITEISPKSSDGEPEWFEISNVNTIPVFLRGWSFCTGEDTIPFDNTDLFVGGSGPVIITRDAGTFTNRYLSSGWVVEPENWNALNDAADTIMLFDPEGILREQVCYDRIWFDGWSYLSIERNSGDDGCSRNSWVVAPRPTPGKINSALGWRDTDTPSMDIWPIPFTPQSLRPSNDEEFMPSPGDALRTLAITLELPPAAQASIAIYGFDGRLLKKFPTVVEETTYWDGSGSGGKAPPGPFFVVATIKEGQKTTRIRKKGILWRK
jgi:hypothetical protein